MTNERLVELIEKLEACPAGQSDWKRFEDICIEILTEVFVPPLQNPKIQPRTYHGTDRRDAVFPNRNLEPNNNWGHLYLELGARMILVEIKNYRSTDIGKEETNQTRNYLTEPMGSLALMVCSKEPVASAHRKRNTIYAQDGKVILFLNKDHLKELLFIKERGEDPSDLIMDLVEEFYLQHE